MDPGAKNWDAASHCVFRRVGSSHENVTSYGTGNNMPGTSAEITAAKLLSTSRGLTAGGSSRLVLGPDSQV